MMKQQVPLWRYLVATLVIAVVVVLVVIQGYNRWWGPQPHDCDGYKDTLCTHTACEPGTTLFERGICYDVHGELETLEVCCLRR